MSTEITRVRRVKSRIQDPESSKRHDKTAPNHKLLVKTFIKFLYSVQGHPCANSARMRVWALEVFFRVCVLIEYPWTSAEAIYILSGQKTAEVVFMDMENHRD
jgi:hypothetical protein